MLSCKMSIICILFKKKKKKLFFSLLVHTPTVTFLPIFPLLFCLFISPLFYCYTSLCFFIICLFFYFYTYCYTSSNLSLSFLPLYLPTTSPLYFFPFFYNLPLLLPILFCINLILFSYSIHIFPIQNCEYSLSLYFLSMNFYSFL